MDDVAAVVLAAGAGERLRPLTRLRPKALCPVDDVPLVDHALARLGTVVMSPATGSIAVNVHHGREQLEAHLDGRVHLSIEEERPLGTAGALGLLRDWVAGRPVVVVNADAWCPGPADQLVAGWDGERVRLLLAGPAGFGPEAAVAGALLPWRDVRALPPEPAGLYETVWGPAAEEARLEVVRHHGPFVDCGTPARYLAANLSATGGASVIGAGAVVEGTVDACVLWPDARVRPGEHLRHAIRAGGVTVLVR